MARDWLLCFALVGLAIFVFLSLDQRLSQPSHREAAWDLGRREGASGAQRLYLDGRFVPCLDRLLSQPDVSLRRAAESAWLVDVPWPHRVVATARRDLTGDQLSELFRIVERSGEFSLEALGALEGRYVDLPATWLGYDGSPLKETPALSNKIKLKPSSRTGTKDLTLTLDAGVGVARWQENRLTVLWAPKKIRFDTLKWDNDRFR